jgi:lambda repressor-like predicted transcriptional regulator
MTKLKTIAEWMTDRGVSLTALVESSGLDQKVVEAIVMGRYTTSPKQRQSLATVLKVSPDEIRWGQTVQVDHMYGP